MLHCGRVHLVCRLPRVLRGDGLPQVQQLHLEGLRPGPSVPTAARASGRSEPWAWRATPRRWPPPGGIPSGDELTSKARGSRAHQVRRAARFRPGRAPCRRLRAVKAAALVLAAILANLAVAWACAAWSPIRSHTDLPDWQCPGYPEEWPGGPYGEYGWWSTEEGFGYRQYSDWTAHGAEGDFIYWRDSFVRYRQVGWPLLAFQSTVMPYYSPVPPIEPRRWQLPLGVILRARHSNERPAGFPGGAGRRPPAAGAHRVGLPRQHGLLRPDHPGPVVFRNSPALRMPPEFPTMHA